MSIDPSLPVRASSSSLATNCNQVERELDLLKTRISVGGGILSVVGLAALCFGWVALTSLIDVKLMNAKTELIRDNKAEIRDGLQATNDEMKASLKKVNAQLENLSAAGNAVIATTLSYDGSQVKTLLPRGTTPDTGDPQVSITNTPAIIPVDYEYGGDIVAAWWTPHSFINNLEVFHDIHIQQVGRNRIQILAQLSTPGDVPDKRLRIKLHVIYRKSR